MYRTCRKNLSFSNSSNMKIYVGVFLMQRRFNPAKIAKLFKHKTLVKLWEMGKYTYTYKIGYSFKIKIAITGAVFLKPAGSYLEPIIVIYEITGQLSVPKNSLTT